MPALFLVLYICQYFKSSQKPSVVSTIIIPILHMRKMRQGRFRNLPNITQLVSVWAMNPDRLALEFVLQGLRRRRRRRWERRPELTLSHHCLCWESYPIDQVRESPPFHVLTSRRLKLVMCETWHAGESNSGMSFVPEFSLKKFCMLFLRMQK